MIDDIKIYENKEEASKGAGKDAEDFLRENKDKNILFLVSGGSAFSVPDEISEEVLGENITLAVLDERYDKTNENNNFHQLTQTDFYKKTKEMGGHFIDTSVKSGQTQEELAEYFEFELRKWKKENLEGIMVATMGMGSDGHTSGIMPYPEDEKKFKELFEGEKWVVAYDASGKNEYIKRVTTTNTFLRKIDKAFVFVVGEDKKEMLLRLKDDKDIFCMPAQVIKEINSLIYTDINF